MSKFLDIYYYLTNAIGVLNIHYNSLTNTYNLNHWPTLIYCASINILTFMFLQFATYTYFKISLFCVPAESLIFFDGSVVVSNYALLVCVITQCWCKRQRIRLANCSEINYAELTVSSNVFGIISVISILVDLNIYLSVLLMQMCVQMLVQRLRNIRKEIQLMHRLQRNGQTINHKLYQNLRQKLNHRIILIAKDACELKSLAEELFSIYQLQLLLSNLMLLYNVCELLVNSFKEMGQMVYQIGMYDNLETRNILRKDDLALNLEFLLLEIQYRELKFSWTIISESILVDSLPIYHIPADSNLIDFEIHVHVVASGNRYPSISLYPSQVETIEIYSR
ncbi:hypothetical protein FF38_09877 [Lucilia cuprina]|uniref:Gustatory receptor n=1 Tax=Lucilia cuprina TaxID=7375 RepID=A0A0L0CM34_LUCCU|nr:hypothetical protein FF38_09877 [Lucilia cuprina]